MQFFMILMGSLLLPLAWLQEPAKTQVPKRPISSAKKSNSIFSRAESSRSRPGARQYHDCGLA